MLHGDPRPSAGAVSSVVPPTDGSKEFEDFIYLLSHDVRNSVRALVEVPQWIEDDLLAGGHLLDGTLADNIRLMNTHTRRLDRMLSDLLVYSRVGRKQTLQNMKLTTALEVVIDQLSPPLGMTIDADFACKTLRIGDRDIVTLLSALVSNAIKHHDKDIGDIELASWQDDSQFVLSVRDDGPGIAPRYRARAMEAMTTLRPRDEVEGSGMGLAIVRKIVDFYGGAFTFVDDPNRGGTHVQITFPAL